VQKGMEGVFHGRNKAQVQDNSNGGELMTLGGTRPLKTEGIGYREKVFKKLRTEGG